MVVLVTKMIKIDNKFASFYIGQTVYGMSGYPLGVLEEVRVNPSTGDQEFWVRNDNGLIEFSYFCLV
jgi:hypothetical protein